MPRIDFTSHRLFLAADLVAGQPVEATREQANYLLNVLRLGDGATLLVFNGRDGEWRARLALAGRKQVVLHPGDRIRAQPPAPALWYCFAPLKSARLDYMVQKAVEMGVGRLLPVLTRRTQVTRINLDRMRANVIEAAEQCGILALPEVDDPVAIDRLLADWPTGRPLVFCDEDADDAGPIATLLHLSRGTPLAVLVGPEGGFDPAERSALLHLPGVLRISLGPRILRADTAAIAALALVQATLGDWDA